MDPTQGVGLQPLIPGHSSGISHSSATSYSGRHEASASVNQAWKTELSWVNGGQACVTRPSQRSLLCWIQSPMDVLFIQPSTRSLTVSLRIRWHQPTPSMLLRHWWSNTSSRLRSSTRRGHVSLSYSETAHTVVLYTRPFRLRLMPFWRHRWRRLAKAILAF